MQELNNNSFDKIIPLAEGINHNKALVYSVLEKNHHGRVIVDNIESPTVALIITKVNFMFVLGKLTSKNTYDSLKEVIFSRTLKSEEIILFTYTEDIRLSLDKIFNNIRGIKIYRKQFKFCSSKFMHYNKKSELIIPEGFELREMNNELALQAGMDLSICNFSKDAFGFSLLKDGKIISLCYSLFNGGGETEIDIKTNEHFQRKGYGTIVASAFLSECIRKQINPNWACWPYREASCALAKKLGFKELEDIPVQFWAEKM